ncbi:MAG: hypothetical protein ACUVXJ_06640 [Phycisphaerae bacterium]
MVTLWMGAKTDGAGRQDNVEVAVVTEACHILEPGPAGLGPASSRGLCGAATMAYRFDMQCEA